MTLRPIRQRVILLARSGDTPTRGLAKVYAELYGGTFTKQTFAALGMLAKLLGRDEAALFLLEHSYKEMRNPLAELIPLAKARAAGFRPADAPDVEEQKRFDAAVAESAWRKRMQRWLRMGRNYREVEDRLVSDQRDGKMGAANSRAAQRQAMDDFRLWERKGKPEI